MTAYKICFFYDEDLGPIFTTEEDAQKYLDWYCAKNAGSDFLKKENFAIEEVEIYESFDPKDWR